MEEKTWITDTSSTPVSDLKTSPAKSCNAPKLQSTETSDEAAKYDKVLNALESIGSLPESESESKSKSKDAAARTSPLRDLEKIWLSKECILRYLRACDWDADECIDRIENSLIWRREYGVAYGDEWETLTAESVKEQAKSGKCVVMGYDKGSRPCLFVCNGKQTDHAAELQVKLLMCMLERSIELLPCGQDKLALCVDFKKYPECCEGSVKIPGVSVCKEFLHILQYHYPERLGRALFTNVPWYLGGLIRVCWPFVDPYTKQKCKFNEPFGDYIPGEQLCVNYDGDWNFEFDVDIYWPQLIDECKRRRAVMIENYNRLGGGIGLSEEELRRGLD